MQGKLESTTNDKIANDTYNISFISYSRLLQSQYSKRENSNMRLLYINLNDTVTQEEDALINVVPPIDNQLFPKYANIKSNVPIIQPVVSTTSDPLSEDDSDNTDK